MLVKVTALALLWIGLAAFLVVSAAHERGIVRRLGTSYVAWIDRSMRSMFMTPRGAEIAWAQVALTMVAMSVAAFFPQSARIVLISVVIIAIAPRMVLTTRVQRRRAQIDNQAHGFALALSNTLKTTASVGDGVRFTAEVTAKPLKDELETALREVHIGSTLEQALLSAASRAKSPAFDIVVSAIIVGQRGGGELPRILETTSTSLRELKRLEEMLEKTVFSAKLTVAIVALTNVAIVYGLYWFVPQFFEPLVSTTKGQIAMFQAGALTLAAFALAWKFTRKSI